MTYDQFVRAEIEAWGFDEIDALLEKFEPILTTKGWKWLYRTHKPPDGFDSRPVSFQRINPI